MKIGIFAGTFDPIHNGHLTFAEAAIRCSSLEKVVIVAEKEPYRKKPHATWDHRQAMIERATEKIEQIDHDYGFANKLSHKHTMKDMLVVAQQHYGSEHEFWFLAGSDIFEHMHNWRDRSPHHEYGGFVVALRDEHSEDWLNTKKKALEDAGIVIKTVLIPNEHPRLSSSNIRAAIKNIQKPEEIPENVSNYIFSHKLYQ